MPQSDMLAKPAPAPHPTQAGKLPQTAYKSALTFVVDGDTVYVG